MVPAVRIELTTFRVWACRSSD